ncbi:MAG: hypothetical protein GXY49_10735 [Syntrophomonadaceae bacterium]|nr:hypothetical protein [Syntrophomonadaceae bacterium]
MKSLDLQKKEIIKCFHCGNKTPMHQTGEFQWGSRDEEYEDFDFNYIHKMFACPICHNISKLGSIKNFETEVLDEYNKFRKEKNLRISIQSEIEISNIHSKLTPYIDCDSVLPDVILDENENTKSGCTFEMFLNMHGTSIRDMIIGRIRPLSENEIFEAAKKHATSDTN